MEIQDLYNQFVSTVDLSTVNILTVLSKLILSYIPPYALLGLDSASSVTGYNLTNGQILIGSTSAPVPATLTGTVKQIIISNNSGSIILSLPQDIDVDSSPVFENIFLNLGIGIMKYNSGVTVGLVNLNTEITGVLPIANGGTNSSAALLNGRIMISSSGQIVESSNLSPGQLLIGGTNLGPGYVTGTSNKITVTNSDNSIALTLPNSVYINNLWLQDQTNQIQLGSNKTLTISCNLTANNATYTIPDVFANSSFLLADGNQSINGNQIFTSSLTLSSLSFSSLLYLNASKVISSIVLNNGQIIIGSTGNNPAAGSITGTSNQITVTPGSHSITLSLPQNINTTASVQFSNLDLTGSLEVTSTANQIVLGTTNQTVISSVAPTGPRTVTLPDAGSNSSFLLSVGNQSASGVLTLTNTTNATSVGSGSIAISGGIGLSKDLFMTGGGDIYLQNTGAVTFSPFNYYEQQTTAITFTTRPISSGTFNFFLTRVGRVVTLSWPDIVAAATSSNIFSATAAIPSRFRPGTGVSSNQVIWGYDKSVAVICIMIIGSSGTITIGNGILNSAFSSTGSCGFWGGSISWNYNV